MPFPHISDASQSDPNLLTTLPPTTKKPSSMTLKIGRLAETTGLFTKSGFLRTGLGTENPSRFDPVRRGLGWAGLGWVWCLTARQGYRTSWVWELGNLHLPLLTLKCSGQRSAPTAV